MWLSGKLTDMLQVYNSSEYVKEIIVIDNAPKQRPPLPLLEKLTIYTKGHNIYVNPAWNWGASLANYTILLANDDITIFAFDEVARLLAKSECDLVGLSVAKPSGQLKIHPVQQFSGHHFGCFMMVRNYHYIPEQFRIWYGDNFLFQFSKNRGILKNANIDIEKSTTVNSCPDYRKVICKTSTALFGAMMRLTYYDFNIVIRTSGRPVYFGNCIESIRRYAPTAKLHIIIDTPEDLGYVKATVSGFQYNYYQVSRETVMQFCSKIPITRAPFIYNYYFNIVRPFLNGWCMFLDDDDEMLMLPPIKHTSEHIYLYRVQIGERTIPSAENFKKPPILNDISGISIIFHSSKMIDWTPQRGGDYEFITALYRKCITIWMHDILAKTQTTGNFGKRNDLNQILILKKMKTIAICIPMWKRDEVTSFVLNYYSALKTKLKKQMELVLIACGSEGKTSRKLAEDAGFVYIEFDNAQFAQKHNALYLKAREYNPDACLKIDSDSIVPEKVFKYYAGLIDEGVDYSGITDIYFLIKGYFLYWAGYTNHRAGETTGVGRFMSRNLLNKLNWKPWGTSRDLYVDRILTNAIAPLRPEIKCTQTNCKELGVMVVDIKSATFQTDVTLFTFDKVIKISKAIKTPVDFSPLDEFLMSCDIEKIRVKG